MKQVKFTNYLDVFYSALKLKTVKQYDDDFREIMLSILRMMKKELQTFQEDAYYYRASEILKQIEDNFSKYISGGPSRTSGANYFQRQSVCYRNQYWDIILTKKGS